MKKLCIYHGNCADGFGAAWVVRAALGDDIEFHAGVYQDLPPDVAGRDVIMVDFSYKRPIVDAMAAKASTLVILDHHKSAAEDLAGLPPPIDGPYNPLAMLDWQQQCNSPNSLHALFDMKRSGAGLAWDYFNPGKPRPMLINHIEDRDLGGGIAFPPKLEFTPAIQAVVFSYPYDFKTWDWLVNRCDNILAYQEMIAEGDAILRKHHKDVAELVAITRRRMTIGGHDVPVANLPYTLASDAGHLMAQGESFAACYWDTPAGRVFSLRSTEAGLDVSDIAKKYGGGGHRNASGFRIPLGVEP